MTAHSNGDGIVTAYRADTAEQQIDSTRFDPPAGARWSAYAVYESLVYIVDQSQPDRTALMQWQPLDGALTTVMVFESADITVGEFQDFGVFGNSMVYIENGRIWRLDLTTKQATWLMNMTAVTGTVDIEQDGIMFSTETGLSFFDYGRQTLIDITQLIDRNPFVIDATFTTAAKYESGFARYNQYVLYIGNMGLFAYDLANDKIIPLLLEPIASDLRIEYRYPVALPDGTAFVTGLTSTDGAVGADGPTYKLDLKAILRE